MKLRLIEKIQETPDVTIFIFTPLEPISWKPGQFIHYVLHHEPTDDRGSDRWFTNSAAPFENQVRITTRFSSDNGSTFKKKLFLLEKGKTIEISNLSGDFIIKDLDKEYVFIAGGIGITPFRSMIKQFDHEKIKINATLIYSNRDKNIVYKDDLEKAAKNNPNFKIHYVFSPQHIDESKIRELVPNLQKPIFYVSGPEPMVDSLVDLLKKMGISEDHIKGDWFPGYSSEQ